MKGIRVRSDGEFTHVYTHDGEKIPCQDIEIKLGPNGTSLIAKITVGIEEIDAIVPQVEITNYTIEDKITSMMVAVQRRLQIEKMTGKKDQFVDAMINEIETELINLKLRKK